MEGTSESSPTENCTAKICFWISQIIGLAILAMTLGHIFEFGGGLGGRSNPTYEHNWHVLFLMFGYTLVFGNAILIFRGFPRVSKRVLMYVHLALSGLVIVLTILGMFFIIDMKILAGEKHLQSFHGWIGIFSIALFIIQFIVGVYAFMTHQASTSFKKFIFPWHIKIGSAIFLMGGVSILTVIGYAKTDPERYLKNFLGGFVVIYMTMVVFICCEKKIAGYQPI